MCKFRNDNFQWRWAKHGCTYHALVLAVVVGCGDGLRLVPVSGTVTLDGQPVSQAAVMFQPTGQGPLGTAVTDSAGRYTLQSANRDGLPPGEYRVTIIKKTTTGIRDDETVAPEGIKTVWHVLEVYASVNTTPLKQQVSSREDTYDLKLSN